MSRLTDEQIRAIAERGATALTHRVYMGDLENFARAIEAALAQKPPEPPYLQPGWNHVQQAFLDGARDRRHREGDVMSRPVMETIPSGLLQRTYIDRAVVRERADAGELPIVAVDIRQEGSHRVIVLHLSDGVDVDAAARSITPR